MTDKAKLRGTVMFVAIAAASLAGHWLLLGWAGVGLAGAGRGDATRRGSPIAVAVITPAVTPSPDGAPGADPLTAAAEVAAAAKPSPTPTARPKPAPKRRAAASRAITASAPDHVRADQSAAGNPADAQDGLPSDGASLPPANAAEAGGTIEVRDTTGAAVTDLTPTDAASRPMAVGANATHNTTNTTTVAIADPAPGLRPDGGVEPAVPGLPLATAVVRPLRLPPDSVALAYDAYTESSSGDKRSASAMLTLSQSAGRYALALHADLLLADITYRSTGRVGEAGFAPLEHSETRKFPFRQARTQSVAFADGDSAPGTVVITPGSQDRISVLMQLWAIARTYPEWLAAGHEIAIPLAGWRGVETAKFRVEERAMIDVAGRWVPAIRITRVKINVNSRGIELWVADDGERTPLVVRYSERDSAYRFVIRP